MTTLLRPYSHRRRVTELQLAGVPITETGLTLFQDLKQGVGATMDQARIIGPAFSVARDSNAMVWNQDGLLQYAPHQLLENANLSSQSGSPLVPSGWGGGVAGENTYQDEGGFFSTTQIASSSRPKIFNTITVEASEIFTVGCFIHSFSTSTDTPIRYNQSGGTDGSVTAATINAGGAGWYACAGVQGAADTQIQLQIGLGFSGNDTGTIKFSRPFAVKGLLPGVSTGLTNGIKLPGPPLGRWIGTDDGDEPKYDHPCFDHDPANSNAPLGLWVQEVARNICLQSNDLTTTWTAPGGNTTVTSNAGSIAVGNGTTADDVLHGDSAETVQQAITVTDNTVVSISATVQQGSTGSHDFVKIAWFDESAGANGFEAWFNISTGVVGTAQVNGTGSYTAGSAKIRDIGNGQYRISATGQIPSGQTDGRFEIINTTADAVDTAEATNSVFWSDFQVEEADFPSIHPIPTTLVPIQREADFVTTTDVSWYNAVEGTVNVEMSQPNALNQQFTFLFTMLVAAGGFTNMIDFSAPYSATGGPRVTVRASGTQADIIENDDLVPDTVEKFAYATKENDFTLYWDGVVAGTPDPLGSMPSAPDKCEVGSRNASVNSGRHIRKIRYYNIRKSDEFLADITL